MHKVVKSIRFQWDTTANIPKKPRGQVRTLAELAKSKGISVGSLRGRLNAATVIRLEPAMIVLTGNKQRPLGYYDLKTFEVWWAAYNAHTESKGKKGSRENAVQKQV